MKLILLSFFMMNFGFSFTLNNNFGASFKKNKVDVMVANTSNCTNAGVTSEELRSLIETAINNFWNEVPTSALRLREAGYSDTIANITTGVLCAPTDSSCITTAGANLIPGVRDIVVSCNTDASNFSNSNSVIAVTIPNSFSGKKIAGSVILINDNSAVFANLSKSDKISVLAHEIGHAIGLGHAEDKEKSALMYYKTVNLRTNLGQDDIDGVSYLYPVYLDAFGKGCIGGFISQDKNIPPGMWQMIIGFLAVLFFALLGKKLKLLKSSQARPTT